MVSVIRAFAAAALIAVQLPRIAPPAVAPVGQPWRLAVAVADQQPVFPIRAAFYYPWFPEAWNQQGFNPFTWYHPSLGYYSSSDQAVIDAHIAQMLGSGIQAGIASWWGQGTPTDSRVPLLLNRAGTGPFRWALYYEPEGQGNPTTAHIQADLTYIKSRYGTQPAYLRVGGRPVIFVYGDPGDSCPMADRWKLANTMGFYVVLKVFSGYRTCSSQPNAWHQYAPAVAEDRQAGFSFTISPGFWKRTEATPRLARDPYRWRQNVAHMVGSGEPWQLITTYSEWGEGTQIETATEYGSSYADVLALWRTSTVRTISTPIR